VCLGEGLTALAVERQVRSYLATRRLAAEHGFDFVGVKCQPEMSDGYVTQCVAHLLCNGTEDADGAQPILVHACESDLDGALTMQILHLLSGGDGFPGGVRIEPYSSGQRRLGRGPDRLLQAHGPGLETLEVRRTWSRNTAASGAASCAWI
jgi:L-fucose isomerase-like protein